MLGKIIKHIYVLILIWGVVEGLDIWEQKDIQIKQQIQHIATLNKKFEKKQNEYRRVDEYYRNVDLAIENIKIVEAQTRDLQSKLPSKNDDLNNLQMIRDTGEKINFQKFDLNPSKEEKRDFYFVTKYNLKATGTYLQFLLLLEQIAKGERMLNVPDLELKQQSGKQKGRYILVNANITIESYRYNAKYGSSGNIVGNISKKYADIVKSKEAYERRKKHKNKKKTKIEETKKK